ncbi:efflux RND transporter permease subunit [Leptospira meyeri]|uniref:efflux RND transporter permease subunit n=1 Tax=Leptospira meyeri TaxID=29508 RepID=UPI000C2A32D2|nr:efflux RND transporter permease subunit [Leptospira meyeri]PJZ82140.1 heavy metal RND transporter permease [Leptospira meyeri]PJZ97644.1 heavy metal RND transporter permease [Leptospira meyeri]
MRVNLIQICRFRILAIVLFFSLLSVMQLSYLLLGEESFLQSPESIQITIQWPGKTALQVEEGITKPWEQLLKGISGYKEIESISERGSSQIHLELEEGIKKDVIVSAIRNEYLLQRQRFPVDSLSPKIQVKKSEDQYIVILQKISKNSDRSHKGLESQIRNIAGVSSFVHHPGSEKEVVLEIQPDRIQSFEFPSLSVVYDAIRNYNFGFYYDLGEGLWFLKDFPLKPNDWLNFGIPSQSGEGLLVSSFGSVSLRDKKSHHGTRINGLQSETILINAENGTSLYHITRELNTLLYDHKDWILLYTSYQDFFYDLYRFFVLFFLLDLVLVLTPILFPKETKPILYNLLSFYTTSLLFLGVCSFFSFSIGRSTLFLFLVWKYFLVLFPVRKIGKWTLSVLVSILILWIFVFLNWIPKILGIFSLVHFYFLLFVPFLKTLFLSFSKKSLLPLSLSARRKKYPNKQRTMLRDQNSQKRSSLFLAVILLFISISFSLVSSLEFTPVTTSYGTVQIGRLEFPTSLPEQESIRITKQVENEILSRKITDLLILKQNPSSSVFYFRLNELGGINGFKDLPTESGYFHFLGEAEPNADRKIRFSNANTEILEKKIISILPWLRTKKEIEEVVLCFQPSTQGWDIHSSTKYRNLLGFDLNDSLRERSLDLQSSIVGKMILDKKITDIRFLVKPDKNLDRYPQKPTKMSSGIPVFTESFTNYQTINNQGRIYRKNGETSLEILVKGKFIDWEELEFKIRNFLENDIVQFSETVPKKESLPKYRPVFVLIISVLFLYRKKNNLFWLFPCVCFLFLWRINVSLLGGDYFLFGTTILFLSFFLLWIPRSSLHWNHLIPFFFLFSLSYFLPGDGGRFFMGGFLLISVFFLFYLKMLRKWEIMKTKFIF